MNNKKLKKALENINYRIESYDKRIQSAEEDIRESVVRFNQYELVEFLPRKIEVLAKARAEKENLSEQLRLLMSLDNE